MSFSWGSEIGKTIKSLFFEGDQIFKLIESASFGQIQNTFDELFPSSNVAVQFLN